MSPLRPKNPMTNAWLRARIREYTNDRVVIKRNGEIHVRGVMPNTSHYGWYLYGMRDQIVREFLNEKR